MERSPLHSWLPTASARAASNSFTLVVQAVNDQPTLNSLANLCLAQNAGTNTVYLSGITSGATNESQTLTVTAISDNPSVVPNPTVSYTNASTTGVIYIKPAANATGTATISVKIQDNGGTAYGGVDAVTNTFTVNVLGAPLITTQPANVSACPGDTISFSVTAAGSLTYQWRYQGTNMAGATNATLSLTNVLPFQAGAYDVLLSNCAVYTNSSVATLTVLTNVSAFGPFDATVSAGASISLNTVAFGSAPITYVWRHDGTVISGQTGNSLSLSSFSSTDAGVYAVEVSGACRSVTNTCTLTMGVAVTYGDNATFSVSLSGMPSPTYVWKRNGSVISGATSSSYTLTKPPVSDSGSIYEVTVSSSGVPNETRRFALAVNPKTLTVTADNKTREYGLSNPHLHLHLQRLCLRGELKRPQRRARHRHGRPGSQSGQRQSVHHQRGIRNSGCGQLQLQFCQRLPHRRQSLPLRDCSRWGFQPPVVGDPNPTFTGTITGLRNADPITASYATTATTSSVAGSYNITPSWVDPSSLLANYNDTKNNGTLTVSAGALSISFQDTLAYVQGRPALPLDAAATLTASSGYSFDGKKLQASFSVGREHDFLGIRNYLEDLGQQVFADEFSTDHSSDLGSSWDRGFRLLSRNLRLRQTHIQRRKPCHLLRAGHRYAIPVCQICPGHRGQQQRPIPGLPLFQLHFSLLCRQHRQAFVHHHGHLVPIQQRFRFSGKQRYYARHRHDRQPELWLSRPYCGRIGCRHHLAHLAGFLLCAAGDSFHLDQ